MKGHVSRVLAVVADRRALRLVSLCSLVPSLLRSFRFGIGERGAARKRQGGEYCRFCSVLP
jgi:hypothetical protein